MAELRDGHNRKIDYLRLSITDRCNLRCFYCMPANGVKPKAHDEILSYEEIERFAKAAVAAGISKIRLTGGEPLVRKDLLQLVRMLTATPDLKDMSLTTNGLLLAEHAAELAAVGLKRVNISIDTLDEKAYRELTRIGNVEQTMKGLEKALDVGLNPVKVNAVLIRGINEDPADFVKLTFDYPVHVRFIEYMPIGKESIWSPELYVSIAELKANLLRHGPLEEVEPPVGAGPARYIKFKGAQGTVGFISPISDHFCETCNRLRLTSDGRLRTCLFSDREVDVREKLRAGISTAELIEFIIDVLKEKPLEHNMNVRDAKVERLMSQIGG